MRTFANIFVCFSRMVILSEGNASAAVIAAMNPDAPPPTITISNAAVFTWWLAF
jgi:hypothetical protein